MQTEINLAFKLHTSLHLNLSKEKNVVIGIFIY